MENLLDETDCRNKNKILESEMPIDPEEEDDSLPHFAKSQAYAHCKKQGWRNQQIMDPVFDEHGVPFSPNPSLYQMWRRHHQKESDKDINEEDGVETALSPSSNHFPGFQFRPCPLGSGGGDVIFDDGRGSPLAATGTWVLDQNHKLVSSSTVVPPTRELLPMPPLFSRMVEHNNRSKGHDGEMNESQSERRMRNRCYSDSQEMEDLSISNSRYIGEDSGIAIESEEELHLPSTPLLDDFKPSLNSTPNRALQNCSVAIFYRRLEKNQQKQEAKSRDMQDEKGEENSSKPKSPVKL